LSSICLAGLIVEKQPVNKKTNIKGNSFVMHIPLHVFQLKAL
jgi:hypothetical protein